MLHANKRRKTSSWQNKVSCEIGPMSIYVSQVAVVSKTVSFLLVPVSFSSPPITPIAVGIAIGQVFPPASIHSCYSLQHFPWQFLQLWTAFQFVHTCIYCILVLPVQNYLDVNPPPVDTPTICRLLFFYSANTLSYSCQAVAYGIYPKETITNILVTEDVLISCELSNHIHNRTVLTFHLSNEGN